jgi:exosortase/archaeosortase family protein
MMMLAALYVHFTQKEMWKKGVIFASSLGFAWIGNLVRLFSVVLFARFINPEIAGNQYHDYSGFVFFPIAVAAMVGFSNLLNRNWGGLMREALKPEQMPGLASGDESKRTPAAAPKAGKPAESSTGSYDY